MSSDLFFEHLYKGFKASQVAEEMAGRLLGLRWAVVANTADPLAQGRVTVWQGHQGGSSQSDWLMRVLPWKWLSVPIPEAGDIVLVGYEEGNPNAKGFYVGFAQNLINRASDPQAWVYKWDLVEIAINQQGISLAIGELHILLKYDEFLELGFELSKITIRKEKIEITSPQIVMGTSPSNLANISNWSADTIDFPNAKVTIKGIEVAVVGAEDTDEDIIVDSGQ